MLLKEYHKKSEKNYVIKDQWRHQFSKVCTNILELPTALKNPMLQLILKMNEQTMHQATTRWRCVPAAVTQRRLSILVHRYLGEFEEVKLSPKKAIYSKLNMKGISNQDH